MTIVTTIITFEYNGETTVIAESADGMGGWPDIVSAAEHSARLAVNKLEEELTNESRQRPG